ncbi:glycosyltransferase [Erythrobacter sp.]|uniref:glycosyltransferase n=1 Tax=Erythrobacter sp. TaxID=1042 RepID=UPI0025B9D6AA|nr:glycosyltransferase [Erythrobacter sp.]
MPHYSEAFFKELQRSSVIEEIQVFADVQNTGDLHSQASRGSISVLHIPLVRRLGFVFRPGRLRALLRSRAQICVLSADPRDLGAIWLCVLLRLIGKRVVFWGMFHRIGGPTFVSQAMYRIMAKVSDACISYARIGGLNLISLGAHPEKIFVAGTAIDERQPLGIAANLSAADMRQFRAEKGLGDRKIILQIVRLSRIKQPGKLLELAEELLRRGREDFLIVAIGGGEMFDEIKHEVSRRSLNDVFYVLPPEYDEPTVARWFLVSEVFTIPTCIGLSAHHAFSYGVPIVSDDSLTQQASEYEALSDGHNALLYEAGNVRSYADAIETILDNPELRARLSKGAKATVVGSFSMARKVQAFMKVFDQLARKA